MEIYKDKKITRRNNMSEAGDRRQTKKRQVKVRGCGAAKKGCYARGPMA